MSKGDLTAIEVGNMLPQAEFGPISRTVLALYAGASGDHNPVHIDIDYARNAGLPDVFAHGMLSFGVLTRVVTSWSGAARLREFGARFVSITHVHDKITCTGQVIEAFEAEGEQRLRVALKAFAQDGRETLSGEAVIALD